MLAVLTIFGIFYFVLSTGFLIKEELLVIGALFVGFRFA